MRAHDPTGEPSSKRGLAAALLPLVPFLAFAAAINVALPGAAWAQADAPCAPTSRPIFAGHQFDLEGTLEPTALTTVDGYPDLVHEIREPTVAVHSGDGSHRIFVAEKTGIITVFDDDPSATTSNVFLDVSSMITTDGETGLLGLAFDPEFGVPSSARFGEFYVYLSVPPEDCACEATSSCEITPIANRHHCSNVLRFRATAENSPDPDTVSPSATGELVLEIEQPFFNHNGGTLVFGPDDFLYISSGDGGRSVNQNTAQHDDSLLGKILRIDPRGYSTYVIPPDNPFAGDPNRAQEILHLGLRNPFKISFDRDTGDLWIGDVGAGDWEEIDTVPNGEGAPFNFGWPRCEGTHEVGSSAPCSFSHDGPVIEIPRPSGGGAITGGYVYRGSELPELQGRYVFTELSSQNIYAWDRATVDPATGLGVIETISVFGLLATLGETEAGEILLPEYSFGGPSQIRRFENATAPGEGIPHLLSQTGLFQNTAAATLVGRSGMIEYTVESPLWSDGALKRRWFALPGNQKIGFEASGAWNLPVGTVAVKHFELPHFERGTQRIETRVLLRQQNDWLGFTYRWNQAQDDATLLKLELVEEVCLDDACTDRQTWTFPAPSDCLSCHTDASSRILSLRSEQMNHAGLGGENQLRSLNCMQLFDSDIGAPEQFPAFDSIDDVSAGVHERARSYLDSNCAHCHRPGTPVQADFDIRFETPLSAASLVGVAPITEIPELVDASLIELGDASRSVLWHRQQTLDSSIRMARFTAARDQDAIDLLQDWIEDDLVRGPDDDHDGEPDATDNCPQTPNRGQDDFDFDGQGDACDADTRPDLATTTPVAGAGIIRLGNPFSLEAEVYNDGNGPAQASQLRFFLSADGTHDPAEDPWIGDCFVDPLDPSRGDDCSDAQAIIPTDYADIPEGRILVRYFGACSDALGLATEGDENNNCSVSGTPVALVPEPPLVLGWAAGALLLSRWNRRSRP